MRKPFLLLSCLSCAVVSLSLSSQLAAITFQTRLENIQWTIEGDQFECRLGQAITDFGAGEFVRRAGEQARFRLRVGEHWLGTGSATLLAAAAPWQPGRGDINLGRVSIGDGEVPFNSSQLQAARLLTGLLDGRSPLIRHHTRQGGEVLEVRLLPARFAKAYSKYLTCTAALLPVNFEQIKQAQIGFPGGGAELDAAAQNRLKTIVQFIQADPSVNRVTLDGHADNSGDRLTNRELSRRRGLAVMAYLQSNGVPEEQITLRFHGERYPLVPNSSARNRAKNRRVTLHLERRPVPVAANPAAPAVAAATPDASS